jgi:hypothetical protein
MNILGDVFKALIPSKTQVITVGILVLIGVGTIATWTAEGAIWLYHHVSVVVSK